MVKRVVGLYFSPYGKTAKITKMILAEIGKQLREYCVDEIPLEYHDLMTTPPRDLRGFDSETVVVVGMPVYSGRIPELCNALIRQLDGNGAYALEFVTYGNVTYGDALYELDSYLREQKFQVISAGAFITEHSMFHRIAETRPDEKDYKKIVDFSRLSAQKLKRFICTTVEEMRAKPAPLEIPGSLPTKRPARVPIHPSANSYCIQCGTCSKVCPVGAIDPNNPKKVDAKKCISCAACIKTCPQEARGFYGPLAAASRMALERICGKRKEPEWFL